MQEARAKLGLTPDDCARDYLPLWEKARERLITLEKNEADWMQRTRYRSELAAMDQALAVVKSEPRVKGSKGWLAWTFVAVVLGGLFWWGLQKFPYDPAQPRIVVAEITAHKPVDVEKLQRQAEQAIEKRRWDEAHEFLQKIISAEPNNAFVKEGEAQIKQGIDEERGQQIGFLVGNIQSALEVVNLGEAEALLKQLEEVDPSNERLPEFRQFLQEARVEVKSMVIVKSVKAAMEKDDWELASRRLAGLEKFNPDHPEVTRLVGDLERARREKMVNEGKAIALFEEARKLDEGEFSEEALNKLQEALLLAKKPEIKELYEKMSAYGRVINVPKDFKTIDDAIAAARSNDRIRLAKGTYVASVNLVDGLELEGVAAASTIIEFPAEKGSVVAMAVEGGSARLRELTLRQSGIVNDLERHPVISVTAGQLEMLNCRIENGSGHGVAVMNGARAHLRSCRISGSGWDGVAVTGEKSQAILEKTTSAQNLHNGFDFWNGGSGELSECVALENGRSGIVFLAAAKGSKVTKTTMKDNREVGALVSASELSEVIGNQMTGNLLGGLVLEDDSLVSELSGNAITGNGEVGLAIEKDSQVTSLGENNIAQNKGKQSWLDAVFPKVVESEIDEIPAAPPEPEASDEEASEEADEVISASQEDARAE